ncbi:MAG: RecQ family ATP-dependent DNA helicase [Ktedonobacteraceae bacterium]
MQTSMSWQGQELETLLAEQFHITAGFQPGQREIIERLLQGERVVAIQRTGWGKSLCYQLTSVCLPHLTLVFSPLKALMRDQCRRCNDVYAIPAALVSSDNSLQENRGTLTRAMAGMLKILFLAPERLDSTDWQRYIARIKISLLVVVEAHCISTWGHDFRPHYRRILRTIDGLATGTPVLTLTATANRRVEADILQQLGVARVIRGPLQRVNLSLQVVHLNGDWEKLCYLASVLAGREDTGMIYTATQSSAMMVALFLCSCGIRAEYYRADCADALRQRIEQDFLVNRYRVLCTTTTLGMGLNKADVRFVIHYHAPGSLIDYYQEIGRAGRDNNRAWCVLLYDPVDVTQQEERIEQDRPQEKHYMELLSLLQAHSQGTHETNLLLNTGLPRTRLRVILADLLEQGLIAFNADTRRYTLSARRKATQQKAGCEQVNQAVDLSLHEQIRRKKLEELVALQQYTHTAHCYMAYLSNYLGDMSGYDHCGICSNCRRERFPDVRAGIRIQTKVTHFLEQDFLPCIEQRCTEEGVAHKTGWSLAYYGGSQIGRQVHASKYQDAGPFPLRLVSRATEIAQTRYPVSGFDAIVSVPPTKSGSLVELFARQIAERLGSEYLSALVKTRSTQLQRGLANQMQKAHNVQGVFATRQPEKLVGCTLLLVDDIYDSGYTLYEASKVLIKAGARAVYPLTITRTLCTDN